MNDFSVIINGHNYANAVFPFKYGDFLDEQLDFATLTLSQVSPEVYAPLTPVYITITSNGTNGVQSKEKTYLIAEDSAYETPNGSGFYRHELMLIEETKYLEGFMVESLCVTNAGGREYIQLDAPISGVGVNNIDYSTYSIKNPLPISTNIDLPKYVELDIPSGVNVYYSGKVLLNGVEVSTISGAKSHLSVETITIKASGLNIIKYVCKEVRDGGPGHVVEYDRSITIEFNCLPNYYPLKPWTIKEVIDRALELTEPLIWDKSAKNYVVPPRFHFDYKTKQTTTATETVQARISAGNPLVPTFYKKVAFTEGHIIGAKVTSTPPKVSATVAFTGDSYTVTGSAINVGDYEIGVELTYADGEEVELFEQNSPEFTFTRATLRELLQAIGGYIHAEPRLKGDTIVFDRYGGQDLARYYDVNKKEITDLKEYNYSGKTVRYGIEQACTRIDSYVDNLVNQISATPATVGQPHNNGYQSVRTDSAYLRFGENDSTIFPSAYPILQIHKLYWVDASGSAVTKDKYDITPYVFEKSIYDSQLSSYTDVYPSSKAYGIYYTQGQKNIGGFFFKAPDAVSPVFKEYAILNILRTVTGNPNLTISDYTKLCFELEYIPVYSARVGHGKQYVGDWLKFPRTLAHNQSGNMVETQYYGENIKGTAERLGTIEKSYTFTAFNLNTIPEAGQLWDEEYYIATVSVEVNQDRFRCTVGLSKNFNRISQYIGANSYRRIFEVSERMVQERQSLYTDYLLITDVTSPIPEFKENTLVIRYPSFWSNLLATFTQEGSPRNVIPGRISLAVVQGETKNGKETLPAVALPVISSAFGNVIEFSWEFVDNFSAGMRAVEVTSGNITGTFGQEVQYCDYYGRMYYENFTLCVTLNDSVSYENEMNYPLVGSISTSTQNYYAIGTFSNNPIVKRKDSREALKENYAIEFATDIKHVIIGSALAANNPFVSGINTKAKAIFVILNRPINKFSRKINMSAGNIAARYEIGAAGISISIGQSDVTPYLECNGITATATGKAWAFMTPVYEGEPYTVEDEDGNVSTITPKYGGELLFGRNIDIKNGDNVGAFRIVGTHDVFDYLKQKEA